MTAQLIPLEARTTQAPIPGELMTAQEAEHRKARVMGALNILYRVGDKLGQRKLCAAALDAMNAARGMQ